MARKPANAANGKPAEARKVIETRNELDTDQVIFLGEPEIEYFVNVLATAWADSDSNIEDALKKVSESLNPKDKESSVSNIVQYAGGVTSGLFGRFITSDMLARTDAAVHVAHAHTVHAAESVDDYFTAVDDIEPDSGAAHLNTTELNSGLFLYSTVIDVGLLVANLSGERAAAAEVVKRYIMLKTMISMSAKLGSTAPHGRAQFVMVEMGSAQPRTLAAAFEAPVKTRDGGWLAPTMKALATYMVAEDKMYGLAGVDRVYATTFNGEAVVPSAARLDSVAEVAERAQAYVLGAV